jgi:hypothetical protein
MIMEALTTEASILKICRTTNVSFGCTVGRHSCDPRVYAFFIVWLLMLARAVNVTLSLGIINCEFIVSSGHEFLCLLGWMRAMVIIWLSLREKKLQDLEVLNYIGMNFDDFSLCYHGYSWMLSFYVILVLLVMFMLAWLTLPNVWEFIYHVIVNLLLARGVNMTHWFLWTISMIANRQQLKCTSFAHVVHLLWLHSFKGLWILVLLFWMCALVI